MFFADIPTTKLFVAKLLNFFEKRSVVFAVVNSFVYLDKHETTREARCRYMYF